MNFWVIVVAIIVIIIFVTVGVAVWAAKNEKKKIAIVLFVTSAFFTVSSIAISIILNLNATHSNPLPPERQETEPSTAEMAIAEQLAPEYEAGNEDILIDEDISTYRFNLHDGAAVMERIDAINAELSQHDGLIINPTNLKNFIYLMNGDYSRVSDLDRDFYSITDVFANINNSVPGNLPSFESPYNGSGLLMDDRNPLTTTPDIFRWQPDYDFVRIFTEAQNIAIDVAYETLSLSDTRPYVDEVFRLFVEAFLFRNAIQSHDGETINPNSVTAEAKSFVLQVIMPLNMQMAINFGDEYGVTIGGVFYPFQSVFEFLKEQTSHYAMIVISKFQ